MTIAFDMSETITKYPDQCRELILSLFEQGWRVIILSPNEISSIHSDLAQARIDEKWLFGIENTGEKGRVCAEQNVDIFLDDNASYIEQVVACSPGTMPLQVCRRM